MINSTLGRGLLTVLMILNLSGSFSQNPDWMYWDPWNSPIPSRIITDIAIEANGRKWLGTEPVCGGGICTDGGLAVFDGTDWIVYDSLNSSLNSNFVGAVDIDGSGVVWAGTGHGEVSSFDGTSWQSHPFPTKDNVPVTALAHDLYGHIWASTEGKGLFMFDGTSWAHYHSGNSFLSDYLSAVAAGPDNTVWTGGSTGKLFRFTDSWNEIPLPAGFYFTSAIGIDPENRVWVGSEGLFCHYYAGTWTVCDETVTGIADTAIGFVFDFTFDGNGNTWIAHSKGMIRFDGSEWDTYGPDNSGLRSEHIISLAADMTGNLWIGTADTGLIAYREGGVVDIREGPNEASAPYVILHPPYPNPSTGIVHIRFDLPAGSHVQLSIIDISGQLLAIPVNGMFEKGAYNISWDAGERKGIFLLSLQAGNQVLHKKVVFMD